MKRFFVVAALALMCSVSAYKASAFEQWCFDVKQTCQLGTGCTETDGGGFLYVTGARLDQGWHPLNVQCGTETVPGYTTVIPCGNYLANNGC